MANRTPDTPEVSETALTRMKVRELREHARERGIDGADELRKPELLAAVKDWHHAREHGAGRRRGNRATTGSGAARGSGKDGSGGNTTADTPDVSETALARMKVGELREYARKRGVGGADELRKPDLLAAVKDWHYAREHGGRHRPDAAANGGRKAASTRAAPKKDAGTPAARKKDAGTPAARKKDAGTPAARKKDAGTPAARKKDAGRAAAPKKDAGTPAASKKDAGTPAAPQPDAPQDGDGSVGQRLHQLETAVQDLGKNLNALVRALRSTIGM